MVPKLFRDIRGASGFELAAVFPVFLLVALGTVDVTLILADWERANKAVYWGARVAVVAPPVAVGITDPTYNGDFIGDDCFDADTGQSLGICGDSVSVVCTGQSGGQCVGSHTTFDDTAFTAILDKMQDYFPRLERENVQISYESTSLGFAGRPGGVPMEVTVSIRCMTNELFFLNGLMGWVFSPQAGCPTGVPLPAFATTLTSEAMDS